MECILVYPAWKPEEIFPPKTARSQVSFQHPLGLLFIAGMLLKEGHQVKLIDGAFWKHEKILERIAKVNPGFVGIYSSTPIWKKSMRTATDIKKINRNIHVCVGGPYPIAIREKCFEECNQIDSLCYGEGEYTVLEAVSRIEHGNDLRGVRGLIYKTTDRKIVKNKPRPPIEDLNALPFCPRYLLGDLKRYKSPPGTYKKVPIANIISSRGCNNLCIYCFQIYRDRRIRYRSAQNVVDEMEECKKKYGFQEVRFLDDQFTGDYERVEEITHLIKERNLDITWYCSSIVDSVDKKLLQKMKDAGCWAILFGAESGVQKNLDIIGKNTTLDQIKKAVRSAKEVGIKVYTPFMFGIPGETFNEGLKTIDFACQINPHYVNFNTLTPFPGTTVYDNIDEYGIMSKDTAEFTFQHAAFVPHTMTKKEIIDLREIAFKKFYSRPKYIFKRISEIRNLYDLNPIIKGAISFLWLRFGRNVFNPDKIKRVGN